MARRSGLRTSALRYYEQVGLLAPAARVGGKRHYEPAVLTRLAGIALLQESGFTVAEIAGLLGRAGRDGGEDAAVMRQHWRAMAERKLRELDERGQRIASARRLLEEALRCGCCDLEGCELVEPGAGAHPQRG